MERKKTRGVWWVSVTHTSALIPLIPTSSINRWIYTRLYVRVEFLFFLSEAVFYLQYIYIYTISRFSHRPSLSSLPSILPRLTSSIWKYKRSIRKKKYIYIRLFFVIFHSVSFPLLACEHIILIPEYKKATSDLHRIISSPFLLISFLISSLFIQIFKTY